MVTLEEIGMRSVPWLRTPGPSEDHTPEWSTVGPHEVGLDATVLDTLRSLATDGTLSNLHSVLVVANGSIAYEQYLNGPDMCWAEPLGSVNFDSETLHDARSVTKSVIGALIGIAHGEGLLPDLDAPVLSFFPDFAERYGRALDGRTLRHALTMTFGLGWDEHTHPYWDRRNDENGMWQADSPLDYALSREPVDSPGERFQYNGGLPTILAAVIERVTDTPLDRYAQHRLWRPLGVEAADWIQHRSGMFVAASGLRLTTRDFARFGQMMLDGGSSGGTQVVPRDYVGASLTAQVRTGQPTPVGYGYQWWVDELPVARGNGGQRIVLDHANRMVIVVTAGNYDSADQNLVADRVVEIVYSAVTHRSGDHG